MSAKRKSGQNNTLFNYFSSPKQSKKAPNEKEKAKNIEEEKPLEQNGFAKKIEDREEEEDSLKVKKRNRSCIFDSDSENEEPNTPKPTNGKTDSPASKKPKKDQKQDSESSSEEEKSQKSFSYLHNSIINQFEFEKTECTPPEAKNKVVEKETTKKEKKNKIKVEVEVDEVETTWKHEKLPFLKPSNIKDAEKRRPSDPNYDHHTIFVPQDFLDSLTPAMRQWWILKSKHFDTVLFFKVGKFYELYHMDAVVGVQELGFSFMKGEFAHSGFPESAYGKMAQTLVNKGYKVARVEQTETPEMMAERCKQLKKSTKYDKVVTREICQISTQGTCIYGPQLTEPQSEMSSYMYSIAAKVNPDGTCRIGVTFIDTSIGIFRLSEFEDDKHFSRLLVLFSEYPPGLILTERGTNYGQLKQLLSSSFKDIKQDTLASKSQFCSASSTLEKLASECYFKDKEGGFQWPTTFKTLADDCLPKAEFELTLKALGATYWYLKDSLLDIQLFSIGKFEICDPVNMETEKKGSKVKQDYMVLDAVTIGNLNLLGGQGTLQRTIDFCSTAFGKRLLQQWICRPLCNVEKIKLRQDAIKELFENSHLLNSAQEILKKLPDLERQVAKIHHYGNRFCATDHPDGRAIFYEANTYSKRKICDLLDTLDGFLNAQEIASVFSGCNSRLLRKVTQYAPDGMYVDMRESLRFFKKAFDYEKAKKEGTIIPKAGVDEDYDRIGETIKEINEELEDYLKEQSKFFGCKVVYFGNDKKRYQLEVPENRCGKANADYKLEGSKKGARRYTTEETREFLQRMMATESEKNKIILDINRRIFEKFSQKYDEWREIIHCLTMLDVLCSFAGYARSVSQDVCLPEIADFGVDPYFKMENSRHPCASNIDSFVPNDVTLGQELSNLMILTGPNMGGKSTLMRQIATTAVIAQIGGYVPASACSFSVIDRIFTRLGASDDIVQGQSTFFVELTEASSILRHASKQSLLIVDELGRGTSTHDGNAIATAYVQKLTKMGCRTLFSTHYHNLVDYFVDDKSVQLAHMACMVENDDNPTEESVTLLYKVMDGRCPKSFGFNAAKLGGLPNNVVARARVLAKQIESEDRNRQIFRQVFLDGQSLNEIRGLLKHLSF